MENRNETKRAHVLFEPIKDLRHLIEVAKKEKREVFQIIAFIFLFAVIAFSFHQTISVIQAAGELKGKIRNIEENRFEYASEYELADCKLKEGEAVKFDGNDRGKIIECEEPLENVCSICGKTEGELELEKKIDREHQERIEREEAKARQAAALARKRAAAPIPAAGNKVGDHWVCDKKNDKPRVSKENNNGMHWDRECCLDPDEYPNPWCAY